MYLALDVSELEVLESDSAASFLLLLETDDGKGIYEWLGTRPKNGRSVSPNLQSMLASAQQYPPALALARHHIQNLRCQSWDDLDRLCLEKLEFALAAQRRFSFKMARSRSENPSDFDGEGYYWVIRNSRQRYGYFWVTRDYFLAEAHSSDFDIDPEMLEELDLAQI